MPDHGHALEAQNTKGGIPKVAPPRLASRLQSLPPILDDVHQTPISSCSKGSRGLSVFLRVIGIFTDATISPSPSLRQRPSRYAIRAGRNLPDKEFRLSLAFSDTEGGRRLPLIVIPACRHADGTISSSAVADVWRMVSEDSDEFVSGLASVHRRGDLDDLEETVGRLVTAGRDELDTPCELLEVGLLRAAQRMFAEERDHRLQQVRALAHDVPIQVLAMVIVPPVRDDLADAEELTKVVEAADALRPLRDRELVSDLITEPVAGPVRTIMLPDEADGKASLSVYEAGHPATELDQSFLLVFRTRHVVTTIPVNPDRIVSSAGYTGFPAYSQMRTVSLPIRGAAIRRRRCTRLRPQLP